MLYDFDHPERGTQECPKCRHTMEHLRAYNKIRRNEGYMLDDGRDQTSKIYFWFGTSAALLYRFYRYIAQPFASKKAGEQKQDRFDRLLHNYPHSLICPHCNYILKRK